MQLDDADDQLPIRIRASIGTAIVLDLSDGRLDVPPTTAYLMTYKKGKCSANCMFCPQAKTSHGKTDMLSRICWPAFHTKQVLDGLRRSIDKNRIKRVCIQALNYPKVFAHLQSLIRAISETASIPISVSCQPQKSKNIKLLAQAGANRIGIPLDAATEELFDKIKGRAAGGPYVWNRQFELLREAVDIFGKRNVSTHLIVGLGETDKEMIDTIQKCMDMDVVPGLFSFTPVHGTALENRTQPSIARYRRIQLARYLILKNRSNAKKMLFDEKGQLFAFGVEREALAHAMQDGEPFLTSGCPNCNRPYYNEKPSGPIYNYPRKLTEKELAEIQQQFDLGV